MTTVDVFDSPANATDGIKIRNTMNSRRDSDTKGFISAWRDFKSASDSSRRDTLKRPVDRQERTSTRQNVFEHAKSKLAAWYVYVWPGNLVYGVDWSVFVCVGKRWRRSWNTCIVITAMRRMLQ